MSLSPSTLPQNSFYPQNVVVDELGLGFRQWNDTIYKTVIADSLTSVNLVQNKQVLSPGTFVGEFLLDFIGQTSATVFVGFRAAGNIGWFQVDLGGILSPITFLDGRYGNEGENLIVGGGTQVLLGDVNCDGLINLLDVQPFVERLQNGEYLDKADMNRDGQVDLLDVQPFVDALTG